LNIHHIYYAAEVARYGSINKAASCLFISQSALSRSIKELEEELRLQLQAVGEMVYATHSGKPSDSEDMQEILEYIDGLHEQLAGHGRALRELEGLARYCVCGAENPPESGFCRACGRPL